MDRWRAQWFPTQVMLVSVLRIMRAGFAAAWAAVLLSLVALIALPHLAPHAGRELLVMNGNALAGTLPEGALVVVRVGMPIEVGDLVTFRAADTLLTRRVAGRAEGAADALTVADGAGGTSRTVLAADVRGVVEGYVPVAGAALAALAGALGAAVALGLLGGLLIGFWLAGDAVSGRTNAPRREPLAQPAG